MPKKKNAPTEAADKLSDFTKSFSSINPEIRKNLRKIQEMDAECSNKQQFVEELTLPVIRNWNQTPKDIRQKRYKALKAALDSMERICQEKVKLATKNYELLDSFVDDLDRTYVDATKSSQSKPTEKKKRGRKPKNEEEFDPTTVVDIPVDPNEPTYCICGRVSFGQMVMCDNENCPIEWFHFPCVGLSVEPKGSWYCKQCAEQNVGRR